MIGLRRRGGGAEAGRRGRGGGRLEGVPGQVSQGGRQFMYGFYYTTNSYYRLLHYVYYHYYYHYVLSLIHMITTMFVIIDNGMLYSSSGMPSSPRRPTVRVQYLINISSINGHLNHS